MLFIGTKANLSTPLGSRSAFAQDSILNSAKDRRVYQARASLRHFAPLSAVLRSQRTLAALRLTGGFLGLPP